MISVKNHLNSRIVLNEQKLFVFDSLVFDLRESIDREQNPLALVACGLLFLELEEDKIRDRIIAKLEEILIQLPKPSESGLQIRDCQVAAGYLYLSRLASHDTLPAEHTALQWVKFASENEWFGHSRLASKVAMIADQAQVGLGAKKYLKNNFAKWLKNDYLAGILNYGVVADRQDFPALYDYLSKINWLSSDIVTLSEVLLALLQIDSTEQNTVGLQVNISALIVEELENQLRARGSGVREDSLFDNPNSDVPSFALGSVLYSLRKLGFDVIIGVHQSQKVELENLIRAGQTLEAGGQIVSKSWMLTFMVSFLALLILFTLSLISLAGFEQFWGILLGISLPILITVGGIFVFGKKFALTDDLSRFAISLRGNVNRSNVDANKH